VNHPHTSVLLSQGVRDGRAAGHSAGPLGTTSWIACAAILVLAAGKASARGPAATRWQRDCGRLTCKDSGGSRAAAVCL